MFLLSGQKREKILVGGTERRGEKKVFGTRLAQHRPRRALACKNPKKTSDTGTIFSCISDGFSLNNNRLALLDFNTAVRDCPAKLFINSRLHAPCNPASGRQAARNRNQPSGNVILFAECFHFHCGSSGMKCNDLISFFLSHRVYA